ncbi:prevent-host-death protein [Streptomyces griseoincarnatus]
MPNRTVEHVSQSASQTHQQNHHSHHHCQSFTVTRDGHPIGQLVPLRRRRRFVSRREFAAMSKAAPDTDIDTFRADQDATADTYLDDPYAR